MKGCSAGVHQLGVLLERQIGLCFNELHPIAMHWVYRGVQARMEFLGLKDESRYVETAMLDTSEFQSLISAVTVNVTRFFRYDCAFRVFGDLISKRRSKATGVLRILCLPCSTGEEAYSVAITSLQYGLNPAEFHVDGMDVSKAAINSAIENSYDDRQLKEVTAEQRGRFFESRSGKWRVVDVATNRVSFTVGNVVEDSLKKTPTYDFVFCRNLMVYLSTKAQKAAWSSIRRAAKTDCLFFITPFEKSFFGDDLRHVETGLPWVGLCRLSHAA